MLLMGSIYESISINELIYKTETDAQTYKQNKQTNKLISTNREAWGGERNNLGGLD